MKKLSQYQPEKEINEIAYFSIGFLKEAAILNIKDVLSRHKGISLDEVFVIGVLEDGSLQFKVPKSHKDRQVMGLLAYLIWMYDIKKEDLKNG